VEVSPGDYETANSQGYQNEYGVASDIQEYESQILLAQASLVPEPASGAISWNAIAAGAAAAAR